MPGTERGLVEYSAALTLGTEHYAKLSATTVASRPARMLWCLGAGSLVRLSFPLTLATQPTAVAPRRCRTEPARKATGSIKSGRVNTQRTVRGSVDFRSAWHRCAVKEGEWHAPAASSRNPPGWGWRLVWDCDTAGDVTLGHDRRLLASNDKPRDSRLSCRSLPPPTPPQSLSRVTWGWWDNHYRIDAASG